MSAHNVEESHMFLYVETVLCLMVCAILLTIEADHRVTRSWVILGVVS